MNIAERIKQLKKEKDAVILVHNYQLPEIQDIADFLGDSLGLSIHASRTDACLIVFCGVYFMAETAKIISPDKKVIIPEKEAGCPMADMITAEQLRFLKAEHKGAKVVCYVNTPAEVKAESDLCCTSANAVEMVGDVLKDEKEIIFVPDKYLGHYAAAATGKNLILWDGYCPSHVKILEQDILRQKQLHPEARVLVHPECSPAVIQLADEALSTGGILKYAGKSEAKEFIIGTEIGMLYRLEKENPDKKFYPASELALCPNMKKISLEKVLWALEEMQYEVTLEPDIMSGARKSIDAMLKYKV